MKHYSTYDLNGNFIEECEMFDITGFSGILLNNNTKTKYYYKNGRLHRYDGPAVEYAYGTKMWFTNGILHRIDGPAIELADGTNIWYVAGKEVLQEQHKLYVDIMKLKGLL